MADLTKAEMAYFDSGGDTATLADDPGFQKAAAAVTPDAGAAAPAAGAGAPDAAAAATDPAAASASPAPTAGAGQAAPAAADAPDPELAPVGPDGRPKDPGRYVSHAAMHAERSRRQQVEQQLEQLRREREQDRLTAAQETARLAERVELLNQVLQPAKPAEAKPPTPEEDVIAYIKHIGQRVEELQGRTTEVQQQTTQQQIFVETRNNFAADARNFAQQTPDFAGAYQHLITSRDLELQHYGITDPHERARIINQDEFKIVRTAIESGVSPAQRVYQMARARGWAGQPAGNGAQPAAHAGGAGNGAPPAPPVAAVAPANGAGAHGNGAANGNGAAASVAAEMARLQAGMDAGKTLSAGGGLPANRLPSPQELARMSEREFESLMRSISPEVAERLMSGYDA